MTLLKKFKDKKVHIILNTTDKISFDGKIIDEFDNFIEIITDYSQYVNHQQHILNKNLILQIYEYKEEY
ncbi:hypothetical protein [Fusobacterium sp.]|uniref:hypothetical protein n=1 Tax=Fusobacterium sp. TaxID=68766 RepID=UPI0029015499|nr:hypothetical protein [Fusobacterium sp.]MDU1911766.1 hypothetical protein [Fusobacterium sp.]